MQIPILTYHSLNTTGQEYESNDHVALETDLELLKKHGFRVERLATLIDAFNAGCLSDYRDQNVCALTFDDGVTHDFVINEASKVGYEMKECVPVDKALVDIAPQGVNEGVGCVDGKIFVFSLTV